MEINPYVSFVVDKSDLATRKKIYQLRYDVYCLEKGYYDPNQYNDREEADNYDNYSDFIISTNVMNDVLATVRMIKLGKEGLPIFNNFNLDVSQKEFEGELFEISRLIVSKPNRNDKQLLLSIFSEIYKYLEEREARYAFASIDKLLFIYLMRMGIKFTRIGQEKFYCGHTVIPSVLDKTTLSKEIKDMFEQH